MARKPTLSQYTSKRRFERTPEPRGKARAPEVRGASRPRGAGGGRLFVIHKHAARRLHYDLRLELDGVLKSWAVPKGPSLDPRDKRLAVHVEDHPLEYADFEGTIPKGEYGGGTIMLWDRGRWTAEGDPHEGLRRGRLKFRLDGERLRGRWTLIRTEKGQRVNGQRAKSEEVSEPGSSENWLLVKDQDDAVQPGAAIEAYTTSVQTGRTMEGIAAGAAPKQPATRRAAEAKPGQMTGVASLAGARRADPPAPGSLRPQLATLADRVPEGDQWLHEVKLDGYRLMAYRTGGGDDGVKLFTRNGHDWTHRFAAIAKSLSLELSVEAVLDGEAVVLDPRGISDFQSLQNAMKGRRAAQVIFMAFDLPWCDGHDLMRVPLVERRRILRELIGSVQQGRVRMTEHIEGHGQVVLREACAAGLEGVISKKRDAHYSQSRSSSWLKIKCANRQEFVIGGFTAPGGSREKFGALVVGYYDNAGKLIYAGRVGTGFSSESLRRIYEELLRRRMAKSPFAPSAYLRGIGDITWVRPELVAEVRFAQWTDEGLLRQPAFLGLREDKDPREIRREPSSRGPASVELVSPGKRAAAAAASSLSGPTTPTRLTTPERLLYPDRGAGFTITKRQLAGYYERVAPFLLPHIAGRPLALVRCPDGEGGQCFFQKHHTRGMPPGIHEIEVPEEDGKSKHGLMIRDLEGLLGLVQMNVLEIHPWGSRADRPDRPDRLIFDLDPGPGVAWKEVVEAARLMRQVLEELGLTPFLRTTGGKGLHVVAAIQRRSGWEEVKDFCGAVASTFAATAPERFTSIATKARRGGRIYVDYLRNARGATAIGSYSTRARPGATVAAPLAWDELDASLDPSHLNVLTVPRRLREAGRDPWAGLAESAAAKLPKLRPHAADAEAEVSRRARKGAQRTQA